MSIGIGTTVVLNASWDKMNLNINTPPSEEATAQKRHSGLGTVCQRHDAGYPAPEHWLQRFHKFDKDL